MLLLGRRLGDLGLERGGAAFLFGLLTVAEGKLIFDVLDARVGGLLIMGVLLSLQGYVGGEWFRARRPAVEDAT